MNDPLSFEPWIRATVFCVVIVVLIVVEAFQPRRPRRPLIQIRPNVGLFVTATVAIRLVSMTSLAGFAAFAATHRWGFLNWLNASAWLEFAIAVVLLDLTMYLQHRVFHWVPWLWRLHAVHHSDTWFDVSTGIRFHVGEILVSFVTKLIVVLAIGASIWSVIIFEALLSSATLFTHANVRLSPTIDRVLRAVLVTPDAHRIHHSTEHDEHNHNFGFLLIWWDRWMGTYRANPRAEHASMQIGLHAYRSREQQTLWSLLKQPFTGGRDREYAERP